MKKKAINALVTIFIILIIGAVLLYVTIGKTPNVTVSAEAAQYIGNHSIVYVQAGCSHCKEQEDLFGDNWKYINSLDCISSQTNTQICINANITGTPTWVINGTQYIGVQSIQELENLTGYTGK
jgi:glutaredoxin